MADLSYSSRQYLSARPQYYNSPIHIVQPTMPPETAARKRPKYTSSSLTSHLKMIKYDAPHVPI
ncbi:hypothetical protein D9619_011812 [Psilocybe cf. subviscida]|uniref:Uncharacterized protein n=1 Tax=Psilocybe cf. subviscida TaxID=2480587 RepID=A0A8H5B0F2_9AGAR|nr:hypothetical protein D9619_011812 [Psilocybe cf. subviscida]